MALRDDVIAAQVTAFQTGELSVLQGVLGAAFDANTGGGFKQSDIDAAVAAAVAPLNTQITSLQAQDASDVAAGQTALASAQAANATLQTQFNTLSAKEAPEAALIASLQQSAASLTAALAAINLALNPPPTPVVTPVSTPTPTPAPTT